MECLNQLYRADRHGFFRESRMAFDLVLVVRRTSHPSGADTQYRVGDIVAVYDRSKDPGSGPVHPNHAVIVLRDVDVVGATVEKAVAKLTERNVLSEDEPNPVIINRRRWYIDWENLPASIWSTLRNDGYLDRTWSQAKQYFRQKQQGVLPDRQILDTDLI